MPIAELTLSRTLATQLLKQAQSSPEDRVCGLLLGDEHQAQAIVALQNHASNRAESHQIDATEFALASAQASAKKLRPIAVYHSHPHSPPMPSAADQAASPDPLLPLLVISLNIKGVLEMRAFAPQDNTLAETPVRIFL